MSRFARSAVTVVVAAAFGSTVLLAGSASAAGCRTVTVQNSVPVGIALDPANTSVPYGGCVQFVDNAFGPSVTITVAGGYHVTLNYGENTSGKTNYAATSPGTHAVKADNGTATASGRITVGPQPSQSPSPSRSPAPSPQPTSAPQPSHSSGQQVPPSHHPKRHPGSFPVPIGSPPTGPGLSPTPGVAPSVAGSPPGPLQSTTPSAVAVAGPLEPPTGRELGLPAALAALVLIGVGTAVVRVVMAEPAVDSRRSVGGTA